LFENQKGMGDGESEANAIREQLSFVLSNWSQSNALLKKKTEQIAELKQQLADGNNSTAPPSSRTLELRQRISLRSQEGEERKSRIQVAEAPVRWRPMCDHRLTFLHGLG
jgi:hypothetical protein